MKETLGKNKLELRHLAPYLPYQLKIRTEYKSSFNTVPNTIKIEPWNFSGLERPFKKRYGMVSCQPILRPLSDLTKEIEHNGERFVPCNKLWDDMSLLVDEDWTQKNQALHFINYYKDELCYPLSFWEKLFEWHFDIYSLIDKGLAIDINQVG